MRWGLLVCDHVDPALLAVAGDYEDMFRTLFAPHPTLELVAYDVVGGELPASADECEGWITTGSRASVNDDRPWIAALERFVQELWREATPFVGVCFGHQMLAKALGGRVARSERGWGVGVKEVEVPEELGLGRSYRLLNSHQDQVVELPPGGRVLGRNRHCPVSMLGVGETMVGIQGHPEFTAAYAEALMRSRRGTVIPENTVDEGIATLRQGTDSDRLAAWIVGFLGGSPSRTTSDPGSR